MWTLVLFWLALVPAFLTKTVHNRYRGHAGSLRQADDIDLSSLFGRDESVGRDNAPVLGGPSVREEEMDLSSLFTSGVKAARDMEESSRFIKTMKKAAREFEDKRARGVQAGKRALKQAVTTGKQQSTGKSRAGDLAGKRGAGDASKVVTCVYCDSRCEAQAEASGYASAQEYFAEAIAEMNRIVQGGLDAGMSFELTFVLLPYSITEMSWFFDYSATSSEELLTAINNKFWQDSGLYAMAQGNGCAIDYLAAAPADPAWGYMGSVEGIANMFQLCQAAFSTVRMSPNPISLAKLMTHEFGHMIGMYHDGAMNVAFTGMASYFEPGQLMADCATQFATLEGACQAGNVGCASGTCIMSPTVDGTDYSDCSKAYYGMFYCLVDVMPTFYSDACIAA